jgi:hypothetical protein
MKRIAIIGGGASGLTSAFLLQNDYQITLFEKNNYLGGNALTHYNDDAKKFPNEMGASAFTERSYPYFTKLLAMIGVKTSSITFDNIYTYKNKETNEKLVLNNTFPKSLLILPIILQLRRVHEELVKAKSSLTNAEFFNSLPWFDQKIKTQILYPFLSYLSTIKKEDLDSTPISQTLAVIETAQFHQPFEIAPKRIIDGMSSYIDHLLGLLKINILLNTPVTSIKSLNDRWVVNGQSFDILIASCEPRTLYQLLPTYFPFFKNVKIHPTKVVLKEDGNNFDSNYTFEDTSNGYVFHEKQSKDNKNVREASFDFDISSPGLKVYEATFNHVVIDEALLQGRKELLIRSPFYNDQGLYVIGAYLEKLQFHEEAIHSAISVAETLTPDSFLLRELKNTRKISNKVMTTVSNFLFDKLLSPVYFKFFV